MSIRAHAIIDCNEEPDADRIHTRLDWALPEVNGVRAYWRKQQPAVRVRQINTGSKRRGAKMAAWAALADHSWVLSLHNYEGYKPEFSFLGPGGLSVWVYRNHIEIHSGCRWEGFLTIAPLRHVHLIAFHRIAGVLKANTLAIMRNDARAIDLLWSGASFEEALASLEAEYGPPQPGVKRIGREIRNAVWFLEDVEDPTNAVADRQ